MMSSIAFTFTITAVLTAAPPHPATTYRTAATLQRAAEQDSIYALAVDSTAYPDYAFVYLLDEGSVRYEKDGRGTRTYRQVVQILKPAGVTRWAEQQVAYQPEREKVTVNWMRVVKPSGEVISDKPTLSQTSDVPASLSNPVYSETRVIRYSLANVAPGTLVDLSWTIETTNPPMPGAGLNSWSFSVAAPAMRSEYSLDVPASMTPHLVERHLDFRRTETVRNGRRVYMWAARNITPPKREPFAPDSSVPTMSIRAGLPITWSDIGRWYNGLAKDRYVLTPAVTREVDSIVRWARTRADTLDDLHRWIAVNLRYVSVSLGIGGYQPRFPEATVATGYGDCKDKATLFIAAAQHLGILAYPVLLNSFGGTDRSLPAAEAFNHVIAAVSHRTRAGYTFYDLTTYAFRHGDVPVTYRGGFGLLVLADGSTREVTFPSDAGGEIDQTFDGTLAADGKVAGTYSVVEHGGMISVVLGQFVTPPDSARQAELRRTAPRPFAGATVDTVIVPIPSDTATVATIRWVEHGGDGARPAGQLSILTVPAMFRGPATGFNNLVDDLQRNRRTQPIDASLIRSGTLTTHQEMHLTLPAGWTAQLPAAVTAHSPFGSYHAEYTQVGRELRISRTMAPGTGVYPPSSIGALIDWFKAMAMDNAEFIAISKP